MSNRKYRNISKDEIDWVEENYPFLQMCKEDSMWRGSLKFCAKYEDFNKNFLELEDEYNVEIGIDWDNVPHVWETGERLRTRAVELGKDSIMDMHVYPRTQEICMGTAPMVKTICKADPTIKGIFYNLIIRYFYYHTYWERQSVEPWNGLKHDVVGIIEDYVDNRDIVCVSEYIKYHLSPGLRECLNTIKIRCVREMCLCNEYKMKDCRCGIMEKYDIFREDLLEFKKNSPE